MNDSVVRAFMNKPVVRAVAGAGFAIGGGVAVGQSYDVLDRISDEDHGIDESNAQLRSLGIKPSEPHSTHSAHNAEAMFGLDITGAASAGIGLIALAGGKSKLATGLLAASAGSLALATGAYLTWNGASAQDSLAQQAANDDAVSQYEKLRTAENSVSTEATAVAPQAAAVSPVYGDPSDQSDAAEAFPGQNAGAAPPAAGEVMDTPYPVDASYGSWGAADAQYGNDVGSVQSGD